MGNMSWSPGDLLGKIAALGLYKRNKNKNWNDSYENTGHDYCVLQIGELIC